jgi:hypothetical protein
MLAKRLQRAADHKNRAARSFALFPTVVGLPGTKSALKFKRARDDSNL